MSDPAPPGKPEPPRERPPERERERERSVQAGHAANLGIATAFFAAGVLFLQPSWPVTVGVLGIMAGSTVIGCFILKRGA
jgi:hypothetical protein